jgi:fatty-acyl-CoA synthase
MTLSYAHGASAMPLRGDTIGAALDDMAARVPDACAIVSYAERRRLTFAELRAESSRVARGLIALGVMPGDRVALWSANRLDWIVTQYAVAKAGGVLVHLNPAYKSAELAYTLHHSAATVLIAAARQLGTTETPCTASLRHTISLDSDWRELCARGDDVPEHELRTREALVQPDDASNILYTSGTTGAPKGATMTHHSLINSAFFIADRLRYSDRDRVCLPVPLYHTLGCIMGVLAAMTHGSAIVLPGPMFDGRQCLDSIDAEGCTAFYGVPSMFAGLLRHPAFATTRLDSLRTGIMAGAPCPAELMQAVMTRLHMPDVTICYGMTEAGTLYQSLPDDPPERRISTVGAIHPHVECVIVDPATGRLLPRGETGELWARGYSIMSGYWQDEAATAATRAGRWLKTGDLAVMRDDGYVAIVGRAKEVVISAGQNIYPREIEDVLRTHPHVRDAAVIGVPDPLYGEATCAWIQLHDGCRLTADEVRRYCRERVAPYKAPRRVRFTEEWPTTASGKVQKFRLREWSLQELALSTTRADEA